MNHLLYRNKCCLYDWRSLLPVFLTTFKVCVCVDQLNCLSNVK